MTYTRFEDLPVWKAALDLADHVYGLVDDRSFIGKGDLRDQLQRAALSVGNNIAEGFELGTTQQLITFLYNARGSAGEVRSMLHFCERRAQADSGFVQLKSQISNLKSLAESISRQIRAWTDSLQNSDIKGQRHLDEKTRRVHDSRRRSNAFWAQLDRVRAGHATAPSEASINRDSPVVAKPSQNADRARGDFE